MNPYQNLFDQQRSYFWDHCKNSSAGERIRKLRSMKKWILKHQEDIRQALYQDFRKPAHEVDLTEILPIAGEIKHTIRHLREWMRPKRVPTPISMIGTSSQVTFEPKGVSLVLAPWNFPFQLTVGPVISAIAAGCTAIIKPSEFTPHTTALISRMIGELFSSNEMAVVEGDHEAAQLLTALPFDHIFFTGSPQVGKLVMKAAAENLASVTLELGGRNPVVVDESAWLNDTVRKLVWGKFFNAGQSCMAPNYILVHEKVHDKFLQALKAKFEKSFPEQQVKPGSSPDLSSVVNARHLERLQELIDVEVAAGGKILFGGTADADTNFLSPTVIYGVQPDHPILEQEIFGPVVPILRYRNLDEAIALIRRNEKPLSIYLFSNSGKNIRQLREQTSSGNFMVNETTIAFAHPELPFGGVNHSGIGKAHGHAGFLAFSNEKPMVRQSKLVPSTLLAHAPYSRLKNKLLNLVIRYF